MPADELPIGGVAGVYGAYIVGIELLSGWLAGVAGDDEGGSSIVVFCDELRTVGCKPGDEVSVVVVALPPPLNESLVRGADGSF